jgi:ribosomal protein S18 acetylase RimI-like enzyme
MDIVDATSAADVEAARSLFLEYAGSLGFSLCFQGFDREMATFPGAYVPPRGALLLALANGCEVGSVGLRPLSPSECEMKRLYVRPEQRGLALGRRLAAAVIDRARQAGYDVMRLDTLESMVAARALYRSLGFAETAPYTDNPVPGAVFMALDLRRPPS